MDSLLGLVVDIMVFVEFTSMEVVFVLFGDRIGF